jgi:hypothetical protein
MPQDVFVLVKGSQVWSEPRAISVPGSKSFEWGMLNNNNNNKIVRKSP